MTNYNERLKYIINSLANKVEWCVSPELLSRATVDREKEDEAIAEAKQALTSLIKELVAEAKPSKKHIGDEVAENRSYAGERLFNATIDEFEQNLLKALEQL